MVDDRGIEPRFDGCRPSVFPLSLVTRKLVAGVRVELTCEAYETSDCAASLTRNKTAQ
jgi:hypothetical protein